MEIEILLRGSQANKPDILAKRLIALLKETGPITRPEMVEQLGIARTTLFDAITRLRKHKIIRSVPFHNGCRGRPKVLFALVE